MSLNSYPIGPSDNANPDINKKSKGTFNPKSIPLFEVKFGVVTHITPITHKVQAIIMQPIRRNLILPNPNYK